MIIWPDILGLRPAFRQMGKRLGRVRLLGPGRESLLPLETRAGGASRRQLCRSRDSQRRHAAGASPERDDAHATDAKAFVAFLDSQAAVDKKRKIGTMGYCMGGPITMRTAAAVPDRVGAGASFHGGGLVTAQPDSPHLLVPTMKAQFLFAIAENDDMREPNAKTVLKDTFAKAKLPAEVEVYAGAAHGWCPPDSAVYNQAQAERAWSRLMVLFGKALA